MTTPLKDLISLMPKLVDIFRHRSWSNMHICSYDWCKHFSDVGTFCNVLMNLNNHKKMIFTENTSKKLRPGRRSCEVYDCRLTLPFNCDVEFIFTVQNVKKI